MIKRDPPTLPFRVKLFLIIIGIIAAFWWINDQNKKSTVYLPANDPRIVAAKQQAQDTLPTFVTFVDAHSKDPSYFLSIKTDFVEKDVHEHMWVYVDLYKDGFFYGKLGNTPDILKDMKYEQPVTVKNEDVEDWTIRDKHGNILQGGYSIKALVGP